MKIEGTWESNNGKIHILNEHDVNWHIVNNDIIGLGELSFISDKGIIIRTSKISELRLKKAK